MYFTRKLVMKWDLIVREKITQAQHKLRPMTN